MTEYYLNEILEIKNGKDHKSLLKGSIPVYGSGGLMRYVNKSIYDKESILLPRKGTLANIQYANKPFWTVDTLYFSIVNEEKADVYYLYNYLKILDLSKLNSGTGVPSMTFGAYYSVKVQLPNLSVQKEIAKVLSDLDAKIEINNKINQELEAMAKLLYNYWFVQFDFPYSPPSEGCPQDGVAIGKPYKSSGGKMVYNDELKREIPEGWEVKELGKIEKNIVTGKTPSTSCPNYFKGEIPFICIGDIRGNMHITKTEITLTKEGAETQINKYLPKGSICVTCIASPGLVGFVTEDSQTNQQINSIVCEKFENRYYLYFYLKDYFRFAKAKTGNTFANMNKGDFSSIKVIKPKEAILKSFSNSLKSSIDKILNNSKENQQLTELRDWLLPMLMNGQVTVGDIEEQLGMVAEPREKYKN